MQGDKPLPSLAPRVDYVMVLRSHCMAYVDDGLQKTVEVEATARRAM
jgi:hypothetical protein